MERAWSRIWKAAALALMVSACGGAHARCLAAHAPCMGSGKLEHGGRTRTFRYHLPPQVKPGAPLVLSLHGRMGQGKGQAKLTGFNAVADEGGFIVVYPDGVDRSWADGRGTTPADQLGVDDVGFLTALADHFIAEFGADRRRVYAAGMSNGAMMSYRLACERADRFAAIGPVAALMGQALAGSCAPSRPVSVISFVGTEDPLVPFEGGPVRGDRGPVLSEAESREKWAALNGCEAGPAVSQEPDRAPTDGTRIRREAHGPCREGSEVVFHVVEGGGHVWPGGAQYLPKAIIGRPSQEADASRALWEFFQRFQLP
ncbi:MAG: hydrolase [Myxococcaceae bacterium]|nr:hydrolase [Myxococcaceae bacterium]